MTETSTKTTIVQARDRGPKGTVRLDPAVLAAARGGGPVPETIAEPQPAAGTSAPPRVTPTQMLDRAELGLEATSATSDDASTAPEPTVVLTWAVERTAPALSLVDPAGWKPEPLVAIARAPVSLTLVVWTVVGVAVAIAVGAVTGVVIARSTAARSTAGEAVADRP